MGTDTLDVFRGASYEVAEAMAPTWERRRADIEEVATPVREWMLRELAPHAGDTVLELAAGTGDTGFEALALVGQHGRLICTDFSPSMLAAARRRGAELGVSNVEYRVIDAERIELDTDSVDSVLCRFGYMLMTDPAAALSETRRVLRPGGRLALTVWGAPERNPFFALLTAAGFTDVRTEQVQGRFALPSVDEYLAVIADTAGPIGLAQRRLSEDERAAVKAEVEDSFARFEREQGYELPCVALCAVAS
jgi:ubiquinone/menaquinone biosynthesis C-methylase UbiE